MPKHTHQVFPRTLCVIRNNHKILLIKYSQKKGAMSGFYNCPGGHIEIGEGIIESANREICEETGLRPDNTTLKGVVHISNFFGKNVMMFVTLSEVNITDAVQSDEGELRWVDITTLDSLKVFKDVKLILGKIDASPNKIFTAQSEFDGAGTLVHMTFAE